MLRGTVRKVLSRTLLRRNVVLPFARAHRFVFVYHDVAPRDDRHFHPVYSTTPDVFEAHIRLLASLFELVPLSELYRDYETRTKNCASIVFDDGFSSVRTIAEPMLRAQKIPFAVFVNRHALETGRLWPTEVILGRDDDDYMARLYAEYIDADRVTVDEFRREPLDYLVGSRALNDDYSGFYTRTPKEPRLYMTPDDIRSLHEAGVIIGSHTAGHRYLAALSDEALDDEIEGNRIYLEDILGDSVDHFAFPFGFYGTYDGRAIVTARANHRYLYTTERVSFTPEEARGEAFMTPRIGLRNETPGEVLAAINLPLFVRRHRRLYQ